MDGDDGGLALVEMLRWRLPREHGFADERAKLSAHVAFYAVALNLVGPVIQGIVVTLLRRSAK